MFPQRLDASSLAPSKHNQQTKQSIIFRKRKTLSMTSSADTSCKMPQAFNRMRSLSVQKEIKSQQKAFSMFFGTISKAAAS